MHIAHPICAGRDNDIGRSTLINLPGQDAGGRIGQAQRLPRFARVLQGNGIQSRLHTGRGKNIYRLRRAQARPKQSNAGPPDPRNAADLGQDIEKSVQGTALLYIHLACVIAIQQQ